MSDSANRSALVSYFAAQRKTSQLRVAAISHHIANAIPIMQAYLNQLLTTVPSIGNSELLAVEFQANTIIINVMHMWSQLKEQLALEVRELSEIEKEETIFMEVSSTVFSGSSYIFIRTHISFQLSKYDI